MPRTFGELKNEVVNRLDPRSYDPDEAQKALDSLQIAYPVPPTEIVDAVIWDSGRPVLRYNTHFKADVRDAIRNIRFSSHAFHPSDHHWLQLIHSHWCGWSATTVRHRGDGWVKFVQDTYRHLLGLVPILDSLAFPEDLAHYPDGRRPPEPSLFLFATMQYYYVYDFEEGGLSRAGETLEEVYTGLKEMKYRRYDSPWPVEPQSQDGPMVFERDVFPAYEFYDEHEFRELEELRAAPIMSYHRKDGSVFALEFPIKDFEMMDPHQKLEDLISR
jgi:hypothetical protein